ncbi:SHOCT domain-containing protein [Marinomonas flavescens]|uniref:SHOCT domain-containing protein n=1 Tax=Marinomonas flavescens TaxID=2529379 RepID=UPI001054313D|nr:SHOCT domain-containing protein [Marinomonas flavescens]
MHNEYWSGWSWLLWVAIWFLMISSFGHWGYSYRSNRRYFSQPQKTALDILNERYARGDIDQEEFTRIKHDISSN